MEMTFVPSLNDICDVGNDYVTWCYTTVILQVADLTRTVRTRQKAASPSVSSTVSTSSTEVLTLKTGHIR
jgi:hypothetical protein